MQPSCVYMEKLRSNTLHTLEPKIEYPGRPWTFKSKTLPSLDLKIKNPASPGPQVQKPCKPWTLISKTMRPWRNKDRSQPGLQLYS